MQSFVPPKNITDEPHTAAAQRRSTSCFISACSVNIAAAPPAKLRIPAATASTLRFFRLISTRSSTAETAKVAVSEAAAATSSAESSRRMLPSIAPAKVSRRLAPEVAATSPAPSGTRNENRPAPERMNPQRK